MKSSGSTSPSAVQGHLSRSRPTSNADPKRTGSNRWIIGTAADDLGASITAMHSKFSVKPRADATIANTVLLSMSPDFFRTPETGYGTYREDRVQLLEAEAAAFLKKTFGSRLVSAVLHLDEATPHVQAVVVPILQKTDGTGYRLSGKDMFNPEALHALQESWQKRLEPHGIEPRQVGSKTRHVTLKTYYAMLEEFAAADPVETIEIGDPPPRNLLESKDAHGARIEDWKSTEEARLKDELRDLAVQASKGRLVDAERRASAELRGRLHEVTEGLQAAQRVIRQQVETISLSKDEVTRLRLLPVNAVVARLGYRGKILKGANAIDIVKVAGDLTFAQATTWLAQNFGVEAAATALRQQAVRDLSRDVDQEKIWTKGEKVKRQEIGRQLKALAAPAYRLTIILQSADGEIAQNLGKGLKGTPERFWTAAEVVDKVGDLTAANLSGGNIFITPIDADAHHVLIDDLDAENLAAIEAEGHTPALVLESSPGSLQAILKINKRYPKEAFNAWFKDVNREHGDRKIVGPAPPMRLAAFENRKDKHRDGVTGKFPWVRIRTAVNTFCERSRAVVQQYTLDLSKQARLRLEADQRRLQEAPEEDRRSDPLSSRSGRRLG